MTLQFLDCSKQAGDHPPVHQELNVDQDGLGKVVVEDLFADFRVRLHEDVDPDDLEDSQLLAISASENQNPSSFG